MSSRSWRQYIDDEKKYTIEDEISDLQARIALKISAISHLENSKRIFGADPKAINRKIKQLKLKQEGLEYELSRLKKTIVNVPEPVIATEEVDFSDADTAEYVAPEVVEEVSPEVEVVIELAVADWGPEVEEKATQMVQELSRDDKVEMQNELSGDGMPQEGKVEIEGNKYKFVRIFVEAVLPKDYNPTERGLEGFADRNEFVNYCIDIIEKDPTLLLIVSDKMRKNKGLNNVLRLIARLSVV